MTNESILHIEKTTVSHGGQWTLTYAPEWPFRFRSAAALRVSAIDATTREHVDVDVTAAHLGTSPIADTDDVREALPGHAISVSGTNARRPARTLEVTLEVWRLVDGDAPEPDDTRERDLFRDE